MNEEQNALEKRRQQRDIDNVNNANNIQNAAKVASASGNPYAAAIGKGVQFADKVSGGKASEKMGQALTAANKMAGTQGRLMQNALNKANKSGISNRLGKAAGGRRGILGKSGILKKENSEESNFDNNSSQREVNEVASDGGGLNVKITLKIIKIALIIVGSISAIMIILGLFATASQIMIRSIGLGTADETSASDAEEKIQSNIDKTNDGDGTLNEETTDENADSAFEYNNKIFVASISRKKYFASNKKGNVRDDQAANLKELEDYYGGNLLYDETSNMETVVKFYFKLMDINIRYQKKCGEKDKTCLDLPLLMATLMIESEDINDVFVSNTSDLSYYDSVEGRKNIRTVEESELDPDFDWSSYVVSKNSSAHDIEILAQHMVSQNESGMYFYDESGYKEFLKEFLEKKYLTDGDTVSVKDGNYVKDVTFKDSNFGQIIYHNQGDYSKYYYSSNPSKPQFTQNGKTATIKSHGCGPTALAIVVSSMLNKEITPIETTSKVCSAGGCTSSGSVWGTLVNVGRTYGLNVTTTKKDQDVIDSLQTGKSLVIVLMGPGTFTSGGHFIVLTGANSQGMISVADPGSRARTEKKWFSFNIIVEQRKKYADYMIFSR